MTADATVRLTIPVQRTVEAARPPGEHAGFRPDIEGLRAVAVILVVLGHTGVPWLRGGYIGVDVFFVISGFLITGLLVRELSRTGKISLAGFYARRAVRLLPVSTLVVVSTLIASWLWLAPTRFKAISLDALYGTFYGINWRLAAVGTDYMHAADPPSPLQHLWSLAVEEQFYLIWPLLLGAVWAWRRTRRPIVVVLCVIIVASLVVSVVQSRTNAPWAYFGAHTRAYELAIGALLAVAGTAMARLPRAAGAGLTWAGLAAVLIAAATFSDDTTFPGYAALLPALGTAAIIAGGTSGSPAGTVSLLRTWPFQHVGRLSYGWYLWHWPFLMIGPAALGVDPSVKVKLCLAANALLVAALSYRLVENPVRYLRWLKAHARRGVSLGLVLSGSAAALALVGSTRTPPLPTGDPAVDTIAVVAGAADPAGALSRLIADSVDDERIPANITPAVTSADTDDPQVYADKCANVYVREPDRCIYGDPQGAKAIYLIGDSHGAHWFPALDAIAKKRGMRFVSLTYSSCQVPSVRVINMRKKAPYDQCVEWRDWAIAKIRQDRPAMVIMASNGSDEGGLVDAAGARVPRTRSDYDALWVAGWRKTINQIAAPGRKLVLLEDNPWPSGNVPACAAANPRRLTTCGRPTAKAVVLPARRALVEAAARGMGIAVIDPTPWFCTDAVCPIVVGNVLVYKDVNHMSTSYARALTPVLDAKVPR